MKNLIHEMISMILLASLLAACGPSAAELAQQATQTVEAPAATPTFTVTPSPSPTAIATRTPTRTPTPTLTVTITPTQIPLPELVNEYISEAGGYQFNYPSDWKTLDYSGVTFVMPAVFADSFYEDYPDLRGVYAFIGAPILALIGDLYTDSSSIKSPEDAFEITYPSKLERARQEDPRSIVSFEINGYPALELVNRDEEGGQNYFAIILAEDLGISIILVGHSPDDRWPEAQSNFRAVARSIIPHEAQPITQIDPMLEELVWPEGKDDLGERPYVNSSAGFQILYPEKWTVLEISNLAMISPDQAHSLCFYFANADQDTCGTPVGITFPTYAETLDFFRQVSFDDPVDEEGIWHVFDELVLNLGPTKYDFGPIERFEVNGYPAIGLQYWGAYYYDYEMEKGNPVMGYIMAVKGADRAAVISTVVPTKFWAQFRRLLVAMLDSFEFIDASAMRTPTPIPTATLASLAAGKGASAESFTFNGQKLKIKGAYLDTDLTRALKRSGQEAWPGIGEDVLPGVGTYIKQPAGTNCLLVMVSMLGEASFNAMDRMDEFTVIDQNEVSYPVAWTQMSMGGEGVRIELVLFVKKDATTFTLILPDGQWMPLPLSE